MKLNRLTKIMALTTLVTIAESTMDQGAITSSNAVDNLSNVMLPDSPLINASDVAKYSIISALDTIQLDSSSIINKDLLQSLIFEYSKASNSSLYSSTDLVLDTMTFDSEVIDKQFIKSYIRMRTEEKCVYDSHKLMAKSILDTIPLDLQFIDRTTFKAFAYVESKFNPKAHNSYSGASGLFQLMAITWRGVGEGKFRDNRYNPEKNARAGRTYLDFLENDIPKNIIKYNITWEKLSLQEKINIIAVAYNAGHGKLYSVRGNIKRMPRESREYIDKLKDATLIIKLDDLMNFSVLKNSDDISKNLSNTASYSELQSNSLYPQSNSSPDSAISFAKQMRNITEVLESVETYLSKNYSGWRK